MIIDFSSSRNEIDILENGSESNGVVDFWFFLSGETNAFGITSSFDIEYTFVGPHMLVIAN